MVKRAHAKWHARNSFRKTRGLPTVFEQFHKDSQHRIAIRLARLLEIDPIEIIAVANYHRAVRIGKERKRDTAAEQKFWRQVYNEVVKK